MRRIAFFAVCLFSLPILSTAQETLPAGVTVPVMLTSSLISDTRPDKGISARVMQAVSVTPNLVIPAGAKVVGRVLERRPASQQGAEIWLRFDRIVTKHREFHALLGLRAIASHMEVNDAQIPKSGPDEGTSSYSWTTVQIGGDVRYGTGGPVMAGGTEVGKGVVNGVVARITATPGSECSQVQNTDKPQALWVFSSSACGVYGFTNLKIQRSGLTAPSGEIVLSSSGKSLKLTAGTGLLFQVADGVPVTKIRIDTVPNEYTPVNATVHEPVSMRDFYFEVNPETVRARVVVDYTYPDELVYEQDDAGRGPRPTIAQIPGLKYDPRTQTVVYEGDRKRTVCANVEEHKRVFSRHLSIKKTG